MTSSQKSKLKLCLQRVSLAVGIYSRLLKQRVFKMRSLLYSAVSCQALNFGIWVSEIRVSLRIASRKLSQSKAARSAERTVQSIRNVWRKRVHMIGKKISKSLSFGGDSMPKT